MFGFFEDERIRSKNKRWEKLLKEESALKTLIKQSKTGYNKLDESSDKKVDIVASVFNTNSK